MAIEARLDQTLLPHDESAEDALERAIAAWGAARSRFATVDPAKLSTAGRLAYYRVLSRIGLWSDARVCASNDDAGDRDDSAPPDASSGETD